MLGGPFSGGLCHPLVPMHVQAPQKQAQEPAWRNFAALSWSSCSSGLSQGRKYHGLIPVNIAVF